MDGTWVTVHLDSGESVRLRSTIARFAHKLNEALAHEAEYMSFKPVKGPRVLLRVGSIVWAEEGE